MLRKFGAKLAKRRRAAFRRTLVDGSDVSLERLGTDYGGWFVPTAVLQPGATAICVGAGEDVSFDVALNAKYGMNVVTVDPTPRAREHVKAVVAAAATGEPLEINGSASESYRLADFDPARFRYVGKGVWSEDTTKRFYAPPMASSISHSVVNLHDTETYFEAECCKVATLCRDLAIGSVALLKIDVEGAEYEVIESLIADGIAPTALLVEFDEGDRTERTGWQRRIAAAVAGLKAAGYMAVHLEHWNVTFVRARDFGAGA